MKRLFPLLLMLCIATMASTQTKEKHVFKSVDQMPTFPGGEAALMKWISGNIHYTDESWGEGKVVVQFVVTKTGKVGEVKVVRSVNDALDREAVRVCQALPKFIPGRQNGQPVSVWYTLPIIFKIQGCHETLSSMHHIKPLDDITHVDDGIIGDTSVKEEHVFKSVDQMPTFPGGEAALMKWISGNIHYTDESLGEGKVVVQFVVTKTGKVGEVKVVRSVNDALDREAVRVCKALPNFVPGRQNGQPVSVWYTLPIIFRR